MRGRGSAWLALVPSQGLCAAAQSTAASAWPGGEGERTHSAPEVDQATAGDSATLMSHGGSLAVGDGAWASAGPSAGLFEGGAASDIELDEDELMRRATRARGGATSTGSPAPLSSALAGLLRLSGALEAAAGRSSLSESSARRRRGQGAQGCSDSCTHTLPEGSREKKVEARHTGETAKEEGREGGRGEEERTPV